MIELLPLSVGIGLAVSLVFSEIFGLAAGGMVVPGYIALHLTQPLAVALTLAAGLVTYAIVRFFASFLIIYGRRRTALMILVGYLVGELARRFAMTGSGWAELDIIGYIIPGLIAIWLDRQGIVETISTLLTASVVVRLILILAVGQELHP